MVLAEGILIILVHSKLSGNWNVSGKLTCSAEANQVVFLLSSVVSVCQSRVLCTRSFRFTLAGSSVLLMLFNTHSEISDLYSFSASCTVCWGGGRCGVLIMKRELRKMKCYNPPEKLYCGK